jgi:hypothetical protein
MNRNSTLFAIQAVISVAWRDDFSNSSSETFKRFADAFSKYTEAGYEMDPVMNGTIIACRVEKIARDYFMKYDRLEFNPSDVIINFMLETVGFSVTNEDDLNLMEGNVFDRILGNFKIHEFLEIFGDDSEVMDEFEYSDESDESDGGDGGDESRKSSENGSKGDENDNKISENDEHEREFEKMDGNDVNEIEIGKNDDETEAAVESREFGKKNEPKFNSMDKIDGIYVKGHDYDSSSESNESEIGDHQGKI